MCVQAYIISYVNLFAKFLWTFLKNVEKSKKKVDKFHFYENNNIKNNFDIIMLTALFFKT